MGATGRGRRFPVWVILAVVALLTACQTGVSLEEAKKITAEFKGESFVPPPRTIKDITAILKQEKRADLESVARARALADRQPPKSSGANLLARFYLDRARAAHELGRAQQEIEDYRQAARYAKESYFEHTDWIFFDLGRAQIRAGNFSRGIVNMRKAIEMDIARGRRLIWSGVLSFAHAIAGDLQAAEDALRQAEAIHFESGGWNVPQDYRQRFDSAVSRGRALVLDLRGRPLEGEPFHRRAIAVYADYKRWPKFPGQDARVWDLAFNVHVAGLAENLRQQGRLVEAEVEARRALLRALRSHGHYSAHTAHMIQGLTRVLFEEGRFAEAETLARANLEIYRKTGALSESTLMAKARMQLADALVAQGRWQEALAEYEAIREGLASDRATYQRVIAGNVNWALALIRTGRPDEAMDILQVAYSRSAALLGDKHPSTVQVRSFVGMAFAARGDRRRALAEYAGAIPVLLTHSGETDDEGTTQAARDQWLGLILESYIGLLADIRGTPLERGAGLDAAAEAFRLADVARGRTVQRALAASSARAAAKDPELADLVRQEQDAQKQIRASFGLLANALSQPTAEQDPKVIESLRVKVGQLRAARVALTKEIEQKFPEYATLLSPKPVSVDEARAALRPGEALIATYVGHERSYVWAIPKTGEVAFAAAPFSQGQIQAVVAELRESLDPRAQTLGDIPPFNVARAYHLFQTFLGQVEPGWRGARSLLIVPHGALGQLPFSVLPTEDVKLGWEKEPLFSNYRAVPWLARQASITNLPSVASLVTLRSLPPGDPTRRPFVGFGDPYFNEQQAREEAAAGPQEREVARRGLSLLGTRGLPVRLRSSPQLEGIDSSQLALLPRLPDTAEEVRTIALAMNADLTQDVFLGARANEELVKAIDLSGRRVIVFATHGLVPGDLDGLTQPALALSAPKVAGVGGDGVLTMEEILGLRLDADWVVLSACNTASGKGAGAEAVSGLGSAFFYAGARALLVSNWPVETTSARLLTIDLFRRQVQSPDLSRAEALRQAMVQLIDGKGYVDLVTGEPIFSYAHPIFWAPFTLVGDGGGGG